MVKPKPNSTKINATGIGIDELCEVWLQITGFAGRAGFPPASFKHREQFCPIPGFLGSSRSRIGGGFRLREEK